MFADPAMTSLFAMAVLLKIDPKWGDNAFTGLVDNIPYSLVIPD
jgi:hypothetical protein